jgi:hypothetical protein
MSGQVTTPTRALWSWANTGAATTVVTGYPPNGQPTKTGLTPTDLANYLGVPLTIGGGLYAASTPVPSSVITQWIRWAEDLVEQETNVRLCQTWIAAPATKTTQDTRNTELGTVSGKQVLGVDYDMEEPPYDFRFENSQDDGWMMQRLRWRPVQGPAYSDITGLKSLSYIYPLLNNYFGVSPTWFVVDKDYGIVRLVPNQNVQMLPLFAMQLAFQGFANSVPGGLWFQYVAGLTANDYVSEYSFMQQYVLAVAAMTALGILQGSLNLGVTEFSTTVDGLLTKVAYSAKGPYSGLIAAQKDQVAILRLMVRTRMGGVSMITL